ncbi:MAG: RNA methyltransferase [Bacteroidetes bacterium]|nr:RNA methyltransferase [Bacteroidota bacterium]
MLSKNEIKDIQSLGHKKSRDAGGLFVAEGPKLVEELLAARSADIVCIYALEEWAEGHKPLNVPVKTITATELERISQLTTPHEVLAVVKQFKLPAKQWKEGWTLLLDGIHDPGNLGTIIRLADWFGIRQIICSEDTADCYNPKVVQASMGSIARVHIYYEAAEAILQTAKLPVYAASLDGKDLRKMRFPEAGILLIGNEASGISAGLLAQVQEKIMIPRIGSAESLNAAVATGILLWELRK